LSNKYKELKLYEQYRNDDEAKQGIDPKEVKRLNRPFTWWGRIIIVISALLYIFLIWWFTHQLNGLIMTSGIMFIYLVIKKTFAVAYRANKKELTKEYNVSVIVTCYNESPESVVKVFDNILSLDYPVKEIIFLDDGSVEDLSYKVAKSYAEDPQNKRDKLEYKIIRFIQNRGKREVMAYGFTIARGDYLFMLDSDSEILPNALTELLRPFEDEKTCSTVGHINVLNRDQNFVTKMQAFTYYGAFQLGRAAQSVFGNVIVCSGAFSVHKKDFILKDLETIRAKKYFGIPCSSGDDRELTCMAHKSGGKTVYQNTAYCATMVPTTWKALKNQRRRWHRSGYLVSLDIVKELFPRHLGFLAWTFAEAYLWLIALIIFLFRIFTVGVSFNWYIILVFTLLVMFKHNSLYLLYRPLHFILLPIYTLVYGIFLTFIRFYTLATIRFDGWGTRTVENTNEELATTGAEVKEGTAFGR